MSAASGRAETVVAGVRLFDPANAYTDKDLAWEVLRWHADELRWLTDAQAWLRRAPGSEVWEIEQGSAAEVAGGLIAEAARTMPHGDADAEKNSAEGARAFRYKLLTSSAGLARVRTYLTASARLARGLHLTMTGLDASPEVLWAGGVPWDLRASLEGPVRASLDPGTPHMRSAVCAPVAGPTPLWDAWCETVWPDEQHRTWAMRVLSIGLTGYGDRAMPVLWGEPGRGKTETMGMLADVLGTYATTADTRLIGAQEPHGSVRLDLLGVRFAMIDESPPSSRVAVENLKALTGGGWARGERKYGGQVRFRYSHTLCLTSNDEPHVVDDGLRARLRSIECTGDPTMVREVRKLIGDLSTSRAWAAERPGVLAQMMRHAAGWLEDRSTADPPLEVAAAVEAARREQDPVLDWLDRRTVAGGPTGTDALYLDFQSFCAQTGVQRAPTQNAWARRLTTSGVAHSKGTGGVRLRGLALRTPTHAAWGV